MLFKEYSCVDVMYRIYDISLYLIPMFCFLFFFFVGTDPVGYGDALIAVLPSFPGIKLQ